MQPRRTPILHVTRASERAGGLEDREALGAAEERVVPLVRREGGAESKTNQGARRDARDEDRLRFDAFIDGLCDVFVGGGIAEVRKLALAAASPSYSSAPFRIPRLGERRSRPALAVYQRRSEVDMFNSILSSLDRAHRRGGFDEALREFSRIGRRIGRLASAGAPKRIPPANKR